MIAFISGTIDAVSTDSITIDHDGMGWEIFYPHVSDVHVGQRVKVYTYLHISENDMRLFGFSAQEEKQLFLRLISVKGLGPKTAMNILSRDKYEKTIAAIEEGDVKYLKAMPGIGPKAASQIVLDLKGKLVPVASKNTSSSKEELPKEMAEAAEGLKNFGYRPNEIEKAVTIMKKSPGLRTEEYLKIGLRALMNSRLGG
ncbi:MAG: Holliday junction branch migration protein RuvA [Lactimicrobium sp.]|jgi:Holliday junction DNA helicase RuvA|uniref:Holliday junction branch migration protein RuvA n=1 Tax=Lactimicrobium sp. TaxID=2563780 RepID=UPI002F354349